MKKLSLIILILFCFSCSNNKKYCRKAFERYEKNKRIYEMELKAKQLDSTDFNALMQGNKELLDIKIIGLRCKKCLKAIEIKK